MPLHDLISSLAAALEGSSGAVDDLVVVRVSEAAVTIPVELQVRRGSEVFAAAPRGRLATGFAVPVGTLSLSLIDRSPDGQQGVDS